MPLPIDEPSFWNEKYQSSETPWDLKTPNPVFTDLIINKLIQPGKILIPGSGKGHDAIYAASAGFDVTAVDFSSEAISFAENLAEKNNVKINFLTKDIFMLNEIFNNNFDLIYDYTSFCSINPERRKEYAEKVSNFLKPGGKLIAHLFPIDGREGGPPFNINVIEFFKLFSQYLRLDFSTNKINSVPPRKGNELLQIFLKD
jgi:methyl halide transferase